MSVETTSPDADPRPAGARQGASRRAARAGGVIRPVAGVLADGTAFYAPLGEVVVVDSEHAAEVAAALGFAGIADYLGRRRAAGWTWQEIVAESGQPPSWLRRQAATCGLTGPTP